MTSDLTPEAALASAAPLPPPALSRLTGDVGGRDLPPLHRSASLRLVGEVDRDALKRHLAAMVAAHPALRVTVASSANGCHNHAEITEAFPVAIDDLRTLPELARDAAARGRALAETARRFRFDEILFRARLLIVADDLVVLLLTLHQFVGDARSLFLLVEELLDRLDGAAVAAPPPSGRFEPGRAAFSPLQPDDSTRVELSRALPPDAIQQKRGRVGAAEALKLRHLALSWGTTLPVIGLALLGVAVLNERRTGPALLFALHSEAAAAGDIGPYDAPVATTLALSSESRFADLVRSVAAQIAAACPAEDGKIEDAAMVVMLREAPAPRQILRGRVRVSTTITPMLAPGETLSFYLQDEEEGDLAMILTLPLRGPGGAAARLAESMASSARLLATVPTARIADLLVETQPASGSIAGSAMASGLPAQRPLENELAIIWARALKLPAVGLDEAFFDLGGHSLMLPDLHRDIEALTGLAFEIGLILQYPTVRKFAAFSRERLGLADAAAASRASRRLRRQKAEQA